MSLMVNLEKSANIVKITLEKKNIFGQKAQVILIIDTSISMSSFYNSGMVQKVVEKLIAIAMNMDDNSSIDVYGFDSRAYDLLAATPSNAEGYVNREITDKISLGGGTNYSNPMKMVINQFGNGHLFNQAPAPTPEKKGLFGKLFGKQEEISIPEVSNVAPAKMPTYVLFVTDGDNQDKKETIKLITEASNQAIFWQFVGIGNERFSFLQQLDDLDGRFLDNADFFKLNDFNSVSEEELYDRLLTEFPNWIKLAREKGILE